MPVDQAAKFPAVAHVQNGEPATETTFGRPTTDLEERTDELKAYTERVEVRLAEERNLELEIDGVVSFSGGNLSWDQPIKILLPNRPYEMEIDGSYVSSALSDGDVVYADIPFEVGGSATLPDAGGYDGQVVYLKDPGIFKKWSDFAVEWEAYTLQPIAPKQTSNPLPVDIARLDSVVIAEVRGSHLHMRRNSAVLTDGKSRNFRGGTTAPRTQVYDVTFDGIVTVKDLTVSGEGIDAQRCSVELLDNANAYATVSTVVTRPDSDTVRFTNSGSALAAGTYRAVVTEGWL